MELERNPFGEWLRELSTDELREWRKRFKAAGNSYLADIFSDEIEERAIGEKLFSDPDK